MRLSRLRAGVSQEELALRAGLERGYVSGIERCVRNPTIEVLQSLGSALGVHPRQFFDDLPKAGAPGGPPELRRGRKAA